MKICTVIVTNLDSETRLITMVHSIQTEKEFNLMNQILQIESLTEVNTEKKLKIMSFNSPHF